MSGRTKSRWRYAAPFNNPIRRSHTPFRRCDDSNLLRAIWGFTRPFERIWRFWRFDFTQELQKQACSEDCVKSDSRRLHQPSRSIQAEGCQP
jgi:hypothetical protein